MWPIKNHYVAINHAALARGYRSSGKCAINPFDACSSLSMIMLGVISDIVANFTKSISARVSTHEG